MLMAGTGSGAFSIPILTRALTASGDGGYNQQSDYKAVHHAGYTYLGWVDAAGNVECASVHETDWAEGPVVTLHASLGANIHTSPSLLVRDSDHRLLAFYTQHDGAAMYLRISTNSLDSDPTISGGFGSETNLDSQLGGTAYTYPTVFQQLGKTGDPIVLWYRDYIVGTNTGYVTYSYSTDGGATWAAQQHLIDISGTYVYWKVLGSSVRQDIVVSDGHPVNDAPTKLYHLWADATDWHQTDGTVISAGFPFGPSEGTLVYDGSDGSGWVMDVVLDADDDPVFVFWAGDYGQADMEIRYARWDGAVWNTTTIADEGGDATVYYATGGAVIDEGNPDTVYAARLDGAHFEMFRYTTVDEGATWTSRQISSGSTGDAMWPGTVRNRSDELGAIWLRGSITDEDTYLCVIEGVTGDVPAGGMGGTGGGGGGGGGGGVGVLRRFYISPSTGSDSTGDGSLLNPWASLSKFLASGPIPGDACVPRGGTYNGTLNRNQNISGSGASGHPITIMAYPGETPVFDGQANGTSDTNRYFVLGYPAFNYWTFDGLTLVNFCKDQNGVMTFAGESGQTSGNIIIRNCHITKVGPQTPSPNTSQIIYFGAFTTTWLVENNVIIGPYPTVATDGAAVGTDHGPPSAKSGTVRYNVMKNCHKGVQIYGSDGSPNGVTVDVVHNTFVNCGRNVELVHYMTALIRDNAGTTATESSSYNLYDSGSGSLIADHNFWGQAIGSAPGYQITSGSGIGAASDGGDAGWQGGL